MTDYPFLLFSTLLEELAMLPSSYVVILISHKSNFTFEAFTHFIIFFLSSRKLLKEKEIGEPPQPRLLEKSFPVPIGIIPKLISSGLTPALITELTTHKTVPSPPHIITFTLILVFVN